jgi:signal transduction histidine kinase
MIEAASDQLAELLEELSLAARIESGRYEPTIQEIDSRALASAAAAGLEPGLVSVDGDGAPVAVDVPAVERALSSLARCALRHGGLEHVELRVTGAEIAIAPITPASAPVVLGEDLRDLGAAVAVRALTALGGSIALDGDAVVVGLPA